jgi:acetyl esterase/lipase
MSEPIVWHGMSQAALDAAYNNMAAVADSAQRLADWSDRSARLRARQPEELDIPYGPRPRNRFDIFRCGRSSAPLAVFIHGGWWQRNSKEVFSCIAEGPMAHGIDVALIGYTLAPDATLTEIAAEVRVALDVLMAHQSTRGGVTGFGLMGWSAGGHLTALSMDHPAVEFGLSISGVFDLEPIRHSYINDKLGLSLEDAAALSPRLRPLVDKPLTLAFGLAELPELQRQSVAFHQHTGCVTTCLPLAGHDHFSIIEELARPDGRLSRACFGQLVRASTTP